MQVRKNLKLKNPSYKYLVKSYQEWLDIIGYAPSGVKNMPSCVKEMLHYLEQKKIKSIQSLEEKLLQEYYRHLKQRPNKSRAGALSTSSINYHVKSIYKFLDYLRKVGRMQILRPRLTYLTNQNDQVTVLTQDEVKALFKATIINREMKREHREEIAESLKSRDRAMLAIFYGCGLRRTEGISLDIGDIDFDKEVIHVRKAKGRRERLVPVGKGSKQYLVEYIYDHRKQLLPLKCRTEAIFISQQGWRMSGAGLMYRLRALQSISENESRNTAGLKEKRITLHTLRHSIATHLLQQGMSLESISRFLGHRSLESTQLYTHILGMQTEQEYHNIPVYEICQPHEDEIE